MTDNPLRLFLGMVRSPRATLTRAAERPRSLGLAGAIVLISALCSAGFLMTRVGQLAVLDQQVRLLESFGAIVTDETYAELRRWMPYWPAISAAVILVGWPVLWIVAAALLKAIGDRAGGRATFAQVSSVVVHSSSIFALRSVIAAPLNYARESLGTISIGLIVPAFGESTFPARVLGAIDLFVMWWVVLVAMGLGILYQTRTAPIARWLLGAYAAGAGALTLAQAWRGGGI